MKVVKKEVFIFITRHFQSKSLPQKWICNFYKKYVSPVIVFENGGVSEELMELTPRIGVIQGIIHISMFKLLKNLRVFNVHLTHVKRVNYACLTHFHQHTFTYIK